MTKQDLKKGEIVTLDRAKHIKENGFNVAFFEKEIETKNDGTIVKEYISIYGSNDKYTKLIRPSGEQKFVKKTGDSFLKHDNERFPSAYEVFKNLKQSLNKK
jgi:hypothetical protein|tara:strand:+ start:33 stop:338 length:306 start_codon:yes stop_codon:yes gene_type:complete